MWQLRQHWLTRGQGHSLCGVQRRGGHCVILQLLFRAGTLSVTFWSRHVYTWPQGGWHHLNGWCLELCAVAYGMLLGDWSRHSCLVVYIGHAHGLGPFALRSSVRVPLAVSPEFADFCCLLFLTWIFDFMTSTDCDCSRYLIYTESLMDLWHYTESIGLMTIALISV